MRDKTSYLSYTDLLNIHNTNFINSIKLYPLSFIPGYKIISKIIINKKPINCHFKTYKKNKNPFDFNCLTLIMMIWLLYYSMLLLLEQIHLFTFLFMLQVSSRLKIFQHVWKILLAIFILFSIEIIIFYGYSIYLNTKNKIPIFVLGYVFLFCW